jgi:hypothetical protein
MFVVQTRSIVAMFVVPPRSIVALFVVQHFKPFSADSGLQCSYVVQQTLLQCS